MKAFSLLLVLSALAYLAVAQVPIPSRPDGYALNPDAPATAPVVLEGFFDVLCPDCQAEWPVVKQLLATYPTTVYFLMHTFPLPYHTWGFIANQGAHVIHSLTGGNLTAVRAYADLMFTIQDGYYNAATQKMTIADIYKKLSIDVKPVYADQAAFLKALTTNEDINTETRNSWKYGCSRTVSGTPTFLINGVYIDADSSWTLGDWQSVIDPIINSSSFRAHRPSKATREPVAAMSAVLSKVAHRYAANETCAANQTLCDYEPKKFECCTKGEECIPNVGCRCLLTDSC